jgi:hypothetical protein
MKMGVVFIETHERERERERERAYIVKTRDLRDLFYKERERMEEMDM